jgi:hypothetical protein
MDERRASRKDILFWGPSILDESFLDKPLLTSSSTSINSGIISSNSTHQREARATMAKSKGPKYYAVAKGRVPGIYNTWAECEAQV